MSIAERLEAQLTARRNGSRGEDGQGLAEYALILTFVALAVVASFALLGTNISSMYNTVSGLF